MSPLKKKFKKLSQKPVVGLLVKAVEEGQIRQVRELLQRGADVNERGPDGTSLMSAAWLGNIKMVKLLVSKGAALDEKAEKELFFGCTALMLAVQQRNEDVAVFLFEKGASVHEKDMHGKTIFDWSQRAIGSRSVEIRDMLKKMDEDRRVAKMAEDAEAMKKATSPALQRPIPAPKQLKF